MAVFELIKNENLFFISLFSIAF